MKKQALDIRSTLNTKAVLKKTTKQVKEIESKVTSIHNSEKEANDFFRTTVYLPLWLHRELKIYVAKNPKSSIKGFITEAVEDKLNKLNESK